MRELAMSRPRSPATWESYGYTAAKLVQPHTNLFKLGNQQTASFDVNTTLFLNRPNTNNGDLCLELRFHSLDVFPHVCDFDIRKSVITLSQSL